MIRRNFTPPFFLRDYGTEPLITNLKSATMQNTNFRTSLWTGQNMQITLMSIPVGGDIGTEVHNELDQLIRVERGRALIVFERTQNSPERRQVIGENYVFVIPAGTRHNIINAGRVPLKLSSVYAPPKHPFSTSQKTKADAQASEY